MFSDFLREVAVASSQYSDELLDACLELILAAPTALLPVQVYLTFLYPIMHTRAG